MYVVNDTDRTLTLDWDRRTNDSVILPGERASLEVAECQEFRMVVHTDDREIFTILEEEMCPWDIWHILENGTSRLNRESGIPVSS